MPATIIPSPVGPLHARTRDGALIALSMRRAAPADDGDDPVLAALAEQLDAYFAGDLSTFDVPLELHGNPFERRVWDALLEIPYGETISYGELARRIGAPTAARAVGLANSRNPVAILVPCHRVIGANGKLTGYAGGLDMKRALLDLEGGRMMLSAGRSSGPPGVAS